MALRNKAFGSAQEFVWAQDSSEYAIREGTTTVKVFKNFKEKKSFRPEYGADGKFFAVNIILRTFFPVLHFLAYFASEKFAVGFLLTLSDACFS